MSLESNSGSIESSLRSGRAGVLRELYLCQIIYGPLDINEAT